MNLLVIGSGGREHALCWKLRQSARVGRLWCAPGNAGIAAVAECVPLGDGHDAVIAFARAHDIALVIIGPEGPLVGGLVDALRAAGIRAFGPSAALAATTECAITTPLPAARPSALTTTGSGCPAT